MVSFEASSLVTSRECLIEDGVELAAAAAAVAAVAVEAPDDRD